MPILPQARRERFCNLIALEGMTSVQAYQKAGYRGADRKAWMLVCQNPIKDRIAELRERVSRRKIEEVVYKADYTAGWISTNLIEVFERGMAAKPVLDTKGVECGVWKCDLRAATRALELLGIELGMFVKRSEVRHGEINPLEGTQEELRGRIRALCQRLGIRLADDAGDAAPTGETASKPVPTLQ